MRGYRSYCSLVAVAVLGCGSPAEPAQAPQPEPLPQPEPEPVAPEPEAEPVSETQPTAPEPEFTEGMSVNDAVNAVPQGHERANIEQAALGKPLSDMKLYGPCDAKEKQHAKIRVAIWDGRAVGIDVTVTPKPDDKLAECIKAQIRTVTWRDKAKSLNTVEFAF